MIGYKESHTKSKENLLQINKNKVIMKKINHPINKRNYFSILKSLSKEKALEKFPKTTKKEPKFIEELYSKYSSNIEKYLNSQKSTISLVGSHIYENQPIDSFLSQMEENKKNVIEKIQKKEYIKLSLDNRVMDEKIILTPLPNKLRKYLKDNEREELLQAERKAVVMRKVEYTHAIKKGEKKFNHLNDEFGYYEIDSWNKKQLKGIKTKKKGKDDKENLNTTKENFYDTVSDKNDVLIKLFKKPVDVIQIWWKGIKRKRKILKREKNKKPREKIEEINKRNSNSKNSINNYNNNSNNIRKSEREDNKENKRSNNKRLSNANVKENTKSNINMNKLLSIGFNLINALLKRKNINTKQSIFNILNKEEQNNSNKSKDVQFEWKYEGLMYLGIYKKRLMTHQSKYTKENCFYSDKSQSINKIILIQRQYRIYSMRKRELEMFNQENSFNNNNIIKLSKIDDIKQLDNLLHLDTQTSKIDKEEMSTKNFYLTNKEIQTSFNDIHFSLSDKRETYNDIPIKSQKTQNLSIQSFNHIKIEETKHNHLISKPLLLPFIASKESYSSSYEKSIHIIQSKVKSHIKDSYILKNVLMIPKRNIIFISKIKKRKIVNRNQKEIVIQKIPERLIYLPKSKGELSPITVMSCGYESEETSEAPKTPERRKNNKELVEFSPCKSDDGYVNSKYDISRENILKRIISKGNKKLQSEMKQMELAYNLNKSKMKSLKFFAKKKLPSVLYGIFITHVRKYYYQIFYYNRKYQKLINIIFIRYNSLKYYFTIWKNDFKNSMHIYLKESICNVNHPAVITRNNLMQLICTISYIVNRHFFYRLVVIYLIKEKIDINDNAIACFMKKGFKYGYLYTLENVFKLNLTRNYFYSDEKRNFVGFMDKIDKLNKDDIGEIVDKYKWNANNELKDKEGEDEDKKENYRSYPKTRKEIILENIISKK